MNKYEFDLNFLLTEGEDPEQHLDSLFSHGCDDATVGTGQSGQIGLLFCRESSSAQHAIMSAIDNVISAIPHARLENAGPDLLNLSELAFEFGCTKQNLSKYVNGKMALVDAIFPQPVISGKSSYWHVAEVASWLKDNATLEVSNIATDVYYAAWSLNQAHDNLLQPHPQMMADFTELLKKVA